MDEDERLPPPRELDEYTLSQLEVKKRKCLEDLQDTIKYSWGYRASKRIGHDLYKISWYLSFIGIALIIISFIVMFVPLAFHPIDKENVNSVLNPWSMGLLFGGLMIFIFSSNFTLNDPAKPLRRKLNDLEQVIRIKHEVERGDNFSLDEDKHTEYKSSFKYDYRTKQPNPILVKEIVTSVLGFLNCGGGKIIIGISDQKEILGIDYDLKLFGDWDKFQLAIEDALQKYSDNPLTDFIFIQKAQKDKKELCIITVKPYPKQVYYIDGKTEEFYVRDGNRTIKLTTKQAHEYIISHWVEKSN
jgi:hypothetical protein